MGKTTTSSFTFALELAHSGRIGAGCGGQGHGIYDRGLCTGCAPTSKSHMGASSLPALFPITVRSWLSRPSVLLPSYVSLSLSLGQGYFIQRPQNPTGSRP